MISCPALVCALLLSASGETVLLDFSASWCGPCRQMDPVVAQLAAAGHPIRKVDIDQQPQLAQRFKVDGVPCFVMLVDGREVGRQTGAVGRGELERLLQLASQRTSAGPQPGQHPGGSGPQTFAADSGSPSFAVTDSVSSAQERPSLIPKQISEPFNRMARGLRDAVGGAQSATNVDPGVIERCMNASVRIRILDGSGKSTGSGTVVDQRAGEALVVTCAHIFRESKGQGEIEVDVFGPGGKRTFPGKVVSYDLKSDIGLLRIRPGVQLVTATLASAVTPLQSGETVFSVGCSHGDDPSSRVSRINSLNKFVGAHNIQVAGQPVQGRSGGGLFNVRGELIGVCNAADPADDEGLYVSLKVIHGELARVGLDQVLNRPAEFAVAPPQMPAQPPVGFVAGGDQPRQPLGQSPDPQPSPTASVVHVALTSAEASMLQEVRENASAAEVICIVKPRDPQAKAEVVVIDRASPDLLAQLNRTRGEPTAAASASPEPKASIIPKVRSGSWLPSWGK
ncbi:MAG: trypsin-like peptidase domain-containing protein [Planctomycetaceae bacterium]|nr:trypsin-like peptidase domain-containing protein [Planctomycetaceae bacterium]